MLSNSASEYADTGIRRGGRDTPVANLSERQALRALAGRYQVQTAYYDVFKRRRQVSRETLLATLRCLGAPVHQMGDVHEALREHKTAAWQRLIPPVIVAWEGQWPPIQLTLPARLVPSPLRVEIHYEDGRHTRSDLNSGALPDSEARAIEGDPYVVKTFSLSGTCPFGYHRMEIDIAGRKAQARVISAPSRAYWPEPPLRTWGFFLPLYALHSERSWGAGDFSDMERLTDWTLKQGGGVLATLPLLPLFLEEPCHPSPYSPVSRLLWNEFYIDPARAPEFTHSPEAREIIASAPFTIETDSLRGHDYVAYQRQMRLKRTVLEHLSQTVFLQGGQRLAQLYDFAEQHPHALDYARFRATMETRKEPWPHWPEHLRPGIDAHNEYDEAISSYYLYAQWLAEEQVAGLAGRAQQAGTGLYLDFPLGAHPQGYDAWRYRPELVPDASVGAPPDAVFTQGQDWGMPPMHPETSREHFYDYYLACIRHHLRHAGILRLDHVMGLHRVFMIPHGMSAENGTYVGFHSQELYAILALESHRHRSIIVGEDLGTVPPYVRPAMHRHGLGRMYVLQYELDSRPEGEIGRINGDMVGSTSTHDMPPFKSYWEGTDIDLRLETGLLDRAGAGSEAETRRAVKERITAFLARRGYLKDKPDSAPDVFAGLTAFFAHSRAPLVLVDLEDVWGETEPQNLPGTVDRPNWRRKARYPFEKIQTLPELAEIIEVLNQWRKGRADI